MLRSLLIILVVGTFTFPALAQRKTSYSDSSASGRESAVSIELLGRAGRWSINYDHMVSEDIALGGGFSYVSASSGSSSASALIIPVYGNYYFKTNNHRPFATAGIDIVTATVSGSGFSGSASGVAAVLGGGYEFRGDSGFLFRAAPYLLVGGGGVAFWAGFSFGYAF
ncbi:MAG: hypothetical protein IT289_05580 [Oligoflexia bacterium]|nr:hypothetical protein [Oligoflexia bacterium]